MPLHTPPNRISTTGAPIHVDAEIFRFGLRVRDRGSVRVLVRDGRKKEDLAYMTVCVSGLSTPSDSTSECYLNTLRGRISNSSRIVRARPQHTVAATVAAADSRDVGEPGQCTVVLYKALWGILGY